jgi:hypothetical protein
MVFEKDPGPNPKRWMMALFDGLFNGHKNNRRNVQVDFSRQRSNSLISGHHQVSQ